MRKYIIYGKVIKPVVFKNKIVEPQKQFKALNKNGARVSRLSDAFLYDTKQEAQSILDNLTNKTDFEFQIRTVNV